MKAKTSLAVPALILACAACALHDRTIAQAVKTDAPPQRALSRDLTLLDDQRPEQQPPSGIGLLLIDKRNGNEPYQIEKVFPGSPADRAGIKAKWYLISIDGTNVVSMPLDQSVRMLRGPLGTKVTLELADPAMSKTNKFALRRAKMVLGKEKVEFLDE
jgi:carboxyl-terminal processing protease